ncbi:endonuclease/exonuclease/phosphatase (EEP) superfamily protein YafD [Lewinella aquimaris]|uniref:Endonuclease/exonuclease/phosphatase (EEP) superfamily protein YafD n=1 Tax=Neolewinella aquimaris TaxID=1835722 RepID=A0A840E0Y4_9BACT|nr:endonuclease/exonuclease/phosphatase family protein [Neolewinella aquimaris]MBB4078790.1 endonuclease/exonuclease/phosphatase (EEP) superfamily protein YafD [Neolewinella aquimaris]
MVLSTVLIVCGLLSLIHDVSYWYSKILDFPRVQYLIGSLVCLGLFSLLNQRWKLPAIALALGLLASIGIQSAFILPYYLGDRPVAEANAGGEASVGIMIANVLISNRSSEPFLEMVRARDPDMLLVMEVNDWWMEQLAPLDRDYAHVIEFPTDNAYGMALYSKFPLDESQIKFFNHDDVPSIHAGVALPSGRKFRFHGMHPVAPVPSKEYPDNRGEKEVALGKVAAMVAQDSLPAIVAGDLNDVSWSNTARLFEQESKLNNVRLGRGLYNSFDATSPFLRWPLDHYFVHGDFSLLKLERLPKFGSDHFPMYAEFVLK